MLSGIAKARNIAPGRRLVSDKQPSLVLLTTTSGNHSLPRSGKAPGRLRPWRQQKCRTCRPLQTECPVPPEEGEHVPPHPDRNANELRLFVLPVSRYQPVM